MNTQDAYKIGAENAAEALDQAAYLMSREPDYYRTVEDVIQSYAENAAQSDGITDENVCDMANGFMSILANAGIAYRPIGF